jgi:hypothetical protein
MVTSNKNGEGPRVDLQVDYHPDHSI